MLEKKKTFLGKSKNYQQEKSQIKMKNLILITLVLFVTNCNKTKQQILKDNKVSFTSWKKSIKNINGLNDFQRENLKLILNDIHEKDFKKVLQMSSNIEREYDEFFVLVHSEGEIVSSNLSFFKFNKNKFIRSSLKMEYGKSDFSEITRNQSLKISDFNNLSKENKFESSGFLILTKITKGQKLSSFFISNIPETVEKYLN